MHFERRGIVMAWRTNVHGLRSRRVVYWHEATCALFAGLALVFGAFLMMGK